MSESVRRRAWSWDDPLTFPHVLFYAIGMATGATVTGIVWALVA